MRERCQPRAGCAFTWTGAKPDCQGGRRTGTRHLHHQYLKEKRYARYKLMLTCVPTPPLSLRGQPPTLRCSEPWRRVDTRTHQQEQEREGDSQRQGTNTVKQGPSETRLKGPPRNRRTRSLVGPALYVSPRNIRRSKKMEVTVARYLRKFHDEAPFHAAVW